MLTELMGTEIQNKKLLKKSLKISSEDMEIIKVLNGLKRDLDCLHNTLNVLTEPVLIDSCIYEIMSTNMKYEYYLKMCKEKKLIAEGF